MTSDLDAGNAEGAEDAVVAAPGAAGTLTDALGSWADKDRHICRAAFAAPAVDRRAGRAGHGFGMRRLRPANSTATCDTPMGTAAPYVLPPSGRPSPLGQSMDLERVGRMGSVVGNTERPVVTDRWVLVRDACRTIDVGEASRDQTGAVMETMRSAGVATADAGN